MSATAEEKRKVEELVKGLAPDYPSAADAMQMLQEAAGRVFYDDNAAKSALSQLAFACGVAMGVLHRYAEHDRIHLPPRDSKM